jgi:hypothetical protein
VSKWNKVRFIAFADTLGHIFTMMNDILSKYSSDSFDIVRVELPKVPYRYKNIAIKVYIKTPIVNQMHDYIVLVKILDSHAIDKYKETYLQVESEIAEFVERYELK